MATAGGEAGAATTTLTGYPARVAGCLLGKFCGDALGAAVEGWDAPTICERYPHGLTSLQHTERGYGCYTDDTQMAIALTRSLLARGQCVDVDAARAYAAEYQPFRGYGQTAYKIISLIRQDGIDAESIQTIGTYLIPSGSFANGGAMRIAPVGLAYRHAPPEVLRSAVADALRCTHVHPTAIDGAFVVALAVRYLCERQPPPPLPAAAAAAGDAHGAPAPAAGAVSAANGVANGGGGGGGDAGEVATPLGLLDHLLAHRQLLETQEMADKLEAVRGVFAQAPSTKAPGESWEAYLKSAGWVAELQLAARIAEPFQIRADDAAASAVAALCWHWSAPEDAIVSAVHLGGDTDTVAAITGALAGALHGVAWLPAKWVANLENGKAGRDEVLGLAVSLAELDCGASGGQA